LSHQFYRGKEKKEKKKTISFSSSSSAAPRKSGGKKGGERGSQLVADALRSSLSLLRSVEEGKEAEKREKEKRDTCNLLSDEAS